MEHGPRSVKFVQPGNAGTLEHRQADWHASRVNAGQSVFHKCVP